MAAPSSFSPPERFEEYRLIRLLGQGSMGQVYLAHDQLLDRQVAIKFLATVDPNPVTRERFFTEARAIARLTHPNVVIIYRVGEVSRRPYLVSEFIRGDPLDRLDRPLPWQRALHLGIGLSRGLAVAHRSGVLHRDIKPANAILSESGEVKLLDFGLAKLLDRDGSQEPRPLLSNLPPRELIKKLADDDITAPPKGTAPSDTLREDNAAVGVPLEALAERSGKRALIGSPLYMAPEIWRGEPATPRADVYSLGVLLYELCLGQAPHAGAPLSELGRLVNERGARPLREVAGSVDARFASVVDRCLERDPAGRFASGDALREALEAIIERPQSISIPEGNPYRGLMSFEAEHRGLFFGRDGEAGEILDRLRAQPLVVVAGDSGTGKSSVCRAGVLPAVAERALGEEQPFSVIRLTPGRRPLLTLCTALAPLLGESTTVLSERLATEPSFLGRQIHRQQRQAGRKTLLFIDQMEEIFTLADPAEAALWGEVLGALLLHAPTVCLLCTVRSDFLSKLAALPGLGAEVGRALYLLRPLSFEGIRAAILGPARSRGVSFESEELVDILADSGREPASLPLLQFALAELWEARDRAQGRISAAALRSIGGVTGALARHADGVLRGLSPSQRQEARRFFLHLVNPDGTRARRTEAELSIVGDAERDTLEALVSGRLLGASEEEGRTSYEITHEALIQGWGVLRGWLDTDAGRRAIRRRIRAATEEWRRLSRPDDALWGKRQLDEVALVELEELGPEEHAFVAASRRAVKWRRYSRLVLVAGLFALVALVGGARALMDRYALKRAVDAYLASARPALAQAHEKSSQAEARRQQAFSLFDGMSARSAASPGVRKEEAERRWAQALELGEQAEASLVRATEVLEAALMRDPRRMEARRLLTEVTYERILLAEQAHRLQRAKELRQQLHRFDEDEWQKRLDAPAHLYLETDPAGAAVALQPFLSDERLVQSLGKVSPLGQTPLPGAAVPPGSYSLTLTSPGRVTVRYPLLIARGEQLRLRISLPSLSDVPHGFVYVPEGRFLFGTSADEETRRRWLETVPIHEVRTGAFLIARNETTFAEWIEFLRSIPNEERARRLPRAGTINLHGWLELQELPGGEFQLSTQPTTKPHVARAGEKIAFEGRAIRAVQDWLRFPVAGVSWEDVQLYMGWLRSSGRLRGARPCSEMEWERAARGADRRELPHGDRLHSEDANTIMTYARHPLGIGPDEVGSHPASRSPFGADDMLGNVWEWVSNSLSPEGAVMRGGAYYYGERSGLSTNRQELEPTVKNPTVGVRVCATFPPR